MRRGRAALIEIDGGCIIIRWLEYYTPARVSRLILNIELFPYD